MKKMLSIISCCTLMWTLAACDHFGSPSFSGDNPDSVYVAELYEAATNPLFESVRDVQIFQNKVIEDRSVDEIFANMPEEVLVNVSTVCLRKYPSINKHTIVNEYRLNQAVYDNLPKTEQVRQYEILSPAPVESLKVEPDTTRNLYENKRINTDLERIRIA